MIKNKLNKKLVAVITSAFALTLVVIGGIKASADAPAKNNWTDTAFNFRFKYATCETDVRKKEDTSKLYIKCTESKEGFYVKPYGTHYPHPSAGSVEDCSYGNTANGNGAFIKAGTSMYLQSLVKERKYGNAFLRATNVNTHHDNPSKGVWSPDNINKRSNEDTEDNE